MDRLKDELEFETTLKSNAEKSLEFLMGKFKYVYEYKKFFIKEIEYREKQIERLNNILKQWYD